MPLNASWRASHDPTVSDLGDLLELLHGARNRVSTLRGVVRTWQDVRVSGEAMARLTERGEVVTYAPSGPPEQPTRERVARVWLAPPDRVREEWQGADGERVGVKRGALWWSYDPVSGAVSNERQPEVGSGIGEELVRLLDPAPLIGLLDLPDLRRGRRAGRATVRARAIPRAGDFDAPLWRLGAMGADELQLDVDAERGTLLRVESRFEHQPLAISEFAEVAFDEPLADELFVFTPAPGVEVRDIAARSAILRDLTIEEAVALAPFTVWIPARLPSGWETDIWYAPENHHPPMAPHVHLHYRAADATHGLSIAESPAGEPRDAEAEGPGGPWRDVERDGRRLELREPVESWHAAQVRMDLDGTRILIRSEDLPADALAELAAGLVPAPDAPPRLGT